ncbi:MAG: hypothetical protein FWE03_00370 [Firmicutes bacterium]|nr:hypothetical protein [Bacillota bacterium]
MNVLHDLVAYSAKIDAEALKSSGGATGGTKSPPMNLAGLTKLGRMRG